MIASHRSVQPELMDSPALDADEHRRALRGLGRLNRAGGAAAIVWSAIADLLPARGEPPLRVLDVATGGADVPLALWRRARRIGAPLEIAGCDVSPAALDYAAARARACGASIELFRCDVVRDPLPAGHDVVLCSLFLHHLRDDDEIVTVLRALDGAAGRRVVVSDLRRGRSSLAVVAVASRALTRSRVVHVDGVRSVRAAFRADELVALGRRAGLDGVTVRGRFPARLLMRWDVRTG